ncbi:amidohydrolase family protein [Pochonia chlamydosporia 170]|uniref:Amidohydrolase family protein n=1 Tax=Pochonia chlamydosporia 170 TaxID=1380566 RepID=A0A179F5R6_METCM|nr:amidohydrolase family protein [Pochonia chlamydosporia 170]OAQ60768.2 amidohydrolase family protein [Pochonia chlamydosporia 170]
MARVQLGFGWDFYFLPESITKAVFATVRSLGAKVITSHFIRHILDLDGRSLVSKLHSGGLLQSDILFSHAGGATLDDVNLLRQANCFISVTPNTEEAMQVGPAVPFRQNLSGVNEICSLGVDCHSATSSSLVNEMRQVLQMARGRDSEHHIQRGVQPADISRKTAEVFNMGTIQGARALRMEADIGSIKVGKKADIVLFDALSPSMYCAAQQDPVLAIVLHSSIRDVDTVIVDGCIRKRGGELLPVSFVDYETRDFGQTDRRVEWTEVAHHVMEMQKRFVAKTADYNLLELERTIRKNWGLA